MRKTGGFTLIELLIVIAIIGILAAVLVPNLLSARTTAQKRAVEAYAQNVYKAANAYLAENVDAQSVPTDCASGYTAGSFSVPKPGFAVNSCSVTYNSSDGTVSVSISTPFHSYSVQ